ncbi:MAG: hypothetical protein Q8O19_03125, partial [Rectinemataceae bacterium]|nr:hypothetical protein [Rectinemataceae bacterium]
AGGVWDATNPIIQAGTNITLSKISTDTLRISATGGGGVTDSAGIANSPVTGYHMKYRRVVYSLETVKLRTSYLTTDSLTISLDEVGATAATSFDDYLFYDSTNKASQPDDSIYVIGTIPEDILADSLYIVYKTNNATYASTGGLQDIQWFYTTGDVQQPGAGTATGTSNAVNLASTTWATSKTNLAGVILVSGTRFKVRLIMDFTADNEVVRIGSVVVVGRKR